MNGVPMRRCDFVLPNARGHLLQCSLYVQGKNMDDAGGRNCVVYLHGNCGCRLDGKRRGLSLSPSLSLSQTHTNT